MERELRVEYLRRAIELGGLPVNQRWCPVIERSAALQWLLKRDYVRRQRRLKGLPRTRYTVLEVTKAGREFLLRGAQCQKKQRQR